MIPTKYALERISTKDYKLHDPSFKSVFKSKTNKLFMFNSLKELREIIKTQKDIDYFKFYSSKLK